MRGTIVVITIPASVTVVIRHAQPVMNARVADVRSANPAATWITATATARPEHIPTDTVAVPQMSARMAKPNTTATGHGYAVKLLLRRRSNPPAEYAIGRRVLTVRGCPTQV